MRYLVERALRQRNAALSDPSPAIEVTDEELNRIVAEHTPPGKKPLDQAMIARALGSDEIHIGGKKYRLKD